MHLKGGGHHVAHCLPLPLLTSETHISRQEERVEDPERNPQADPGQGKVYPTFQPTRQSLMLAAKDGGVVLLVSHPRRPLR